MTRRALPTPFRSRRAANRGTRSCPAYSLLAAHASFQPGEDMFAFLDDTYISCPAERAAPTFRALREALAAHTNLDVHLGTTKVWNSGGVEPVGFTDEALLIRTARLHGWAIGPSRPNNRAWWCWARRLGVMPLWRPTYNPNSAVTTSSALSRRPTLQRSPRQHDEAVLTCLQGLLANGGPPTWDANATRRAQLPLQLGGLGLRSAETTRFAAHWASWADAERWSPNTSNLPPQRHWRGACGRGARRRRSNNTRMQLLDTGNFGAVGKATTARGPPGPACDNRRARDAGSWSRKRLSSADLSKLAVAERCHPRSRSPKSRPPPWGGPPAPGDFCPRRRGEACSRRTDAARVSAAMHAG